MNDERFGRKVKAIFDDLLTADAAHSNLKRDNANINGDTAMGAMLQYGANTAKEYYLETMVDPQVARMHRDGDIHIHDLDFYGWTTTCTQIELRKLFKGGFNTGHGHLREPKSIGSYKLPQDAEVSHECEADAQALIAISRRRLCNQAAKETRAAWQEVKDKVTEVDPLLASVMVPECIYRGFCPEFHSCGYAETEAYRKALAEYRRKEAL